MKTIGTKLCVLRKQNGYSQEFVAMELDISQGAYSKIESEKIMPKADVLLRAAKLYQINIQELIESPIANEQHTTTAYLQTLIETQNNLIKTQVKYIEILEKRLDIHKPLLYNREDR